MTEFDEFASRGRGVFLTQEQKQIAEPICRAIKTGNLSINSEIALQDEIYNNTHSLILAANARPMWEHYLHQSSLAKWNNRTNLEGSNNASTV